MLDIKIMLEDGRRVRVQDAESRQWSYYSLFKFTIELQEKRWYGWKTLSLTGADCSIEVLERNLPKWICELIRDYEESVNKERRKEEALKRIKRKYNGATIKLDGTLAKLE